jgi:hypothetical protein
MNDQLEDLILLHYGEAEEPAAAEARGMRPHRLA